jgi:hypothetical protein
MGVSTVDRVPDPVENLATTQETQVGTRGNASGASLRFFSFLSADEVNGIQRSRALQEEGGA